MLLLLYWRQNRVTADKNLTQTVKPAAHLKSTTRRLSDACCPRQLQTLCGERVEVFIQGGASPPLPDPNRCGRAYITHDATQPLND